MEKTMVLGSIWALFGVAGVLIALGSPAVGFVFIVAGLSGLAVAGE